MTTGADPRYSSTTSSVPNPETGAAAHSSSIDTTPSAATTSSALPAVSGKTVNEPEHHFGRDAALGTGVGAAGLAAYETGKHHETSTQNTSNTSGTAGSEGSGPLGSLRDLINQKVGAGGSSTTNANATSALHSTTNEPSSTANTGATSTSRSTTQEPSSADASGLGVGSIRPLVDEKTHSTGTGPSSNQLDSSTGATGSGSGRLDDSTGAAGLPTESIRPLVDEKTNTAGIGSSSNQLNSSTSATGLGSSQFDGSTDPDTFATRETATNPSTGDRAGAIASDTSRSAQSDRHYARDTAAGAVAGAGLAGSYDYLRGHNDTTSRTDTAVPGISDPVSTAGPSHISSGAGTSGLANTASTTRPSDFQSSTPVQPVANETGNEKEHHYGRDAALGAGAAGVGAAAYEHHQHEGYDKAEEKARKEAEKQHEKDIKEAEKQQQKEIKQHEKEVKAAEKQHEKDVKAAEKQHEKELKAQDEELAKAERHRHEKEAAFAGVAGAGAAGIAAHEHNKKDDLGYTSSTTAPYQSGAGDPTQRDRIASIADTRAEGRLHSTDAGVAGATGLGAGGVAAHEHGSDAEPKERKGSILDIFKRHKNDDESHDKHKHGKEAATGAGVLGAGALGAHEYEKHHGSSTGASTIDPARSDPSTDFPQSVSEQKVYRDSLGHFKRDPNERSIEPSSSSAGVIRDGLGHMQPGETTGTSTIPDRTDHSHRGLETAAGGAGLAGAGAFGAHEYEKHHQANTTGTGVTSNTGVGSTVPTTDTSNYTSNTGIGNTATTDATGRDHHRGLEATAAGAGLAGAGTLGAHEYEKHHHSGTTDTGLTGNTDVGNTVPAANTSNYMSNTGVENTAPTDTIVKDHHRGIEGAAAATGVGAIGAHEYNKHHNTTGAAATESQVNPAYDHPAAGSRLAETTNTSHHHHHHKEEAAAAGAAGGLGAAAIAHDKSATGTTGDLGDSRGWVHEGYVHHKTPADLEAEQRNNTPGLGLFHREGRFHGKEGGAPGAVGVPPSERDAAYIESQKHLPTLHGNTGAHGEERSGTDGTYNAYDGSKHNKLHKVCSFIAIQFILIFVGSSSWSSRCFGCRWRWYWYGGRYGC